VAERKGIEAMGWNFDDFDEPDERRSQRLPGAAGFDPRAFDVHGLYESDSDDEPPRGRYRSFLIGVGVALVTLLVIMAMMAGMVGYLLKPQNNAARSQRVQNRPQPSAADLVSAHYRTSTWAEPPNSLLATPTPVSPDIVAEADAEYLLLSNIYERVNPSVVNIEIVSSFHTGSDIIDASGSGFVLDMEGHIATNSHVVRDAEEILVTFSDGYVAAAKLVGMDDYSDLAVIKVDPEKAPLVPVLLGDSNTLHVGQRVVAIGNPFGLDGSMTVGIVSALDRSLRSAQLLDPVSYSGYENPSIIQVDAAVNPGNSGGPLLDSYGQVVGINAAISTDTGRFQGVAFAIPVNTLKRVVPQLIATGKAEYSWLGITTPPSDSGGVSLAALADQLDFPVRSGVLVDGVIEGSPAARAGLQGGTQWESVRGMDIPVDGDIVVAINGTLVRDIDDLLAYLVENTSPGDVVVLTIVRGDQTLDLDVTLGTRP
jgi:2-alkenal reductase